VTTPTPSPPKARLARRLTVPLLILYGLGVTVGAGIYVLIGEIAHRAGIYSPYAFMLAALLIAPTTYSFAKLVARFPVSAGEARYVEEGFKLKWLGILVGLLVALSGIVSTATLSVGGVGYLQEFIALPAPVLIVTILCLFTGFALVGIKESVGIAAVLTLIEVGGLILLIGSGIAASPEAVAQAISAPFVEFDFRALGLVASASVLAFYAFIGFEDMVNVAEEVKDPARTFPVAILVTLIVTMLLYFLVSTVAVSLVSPDELGQSNAPITLIAERTGMLSPAVLSGIGALSALNGILIQIIMASRVLYGLSRQSELPSILSYVHPRTHTPIVSTLLVAGIVLFLALLFPLAGLAETTSRITFVTFTLVNCALITITLREANWRIARVALSAPILIPLIGAIGSIGLMVISLA
jgi:basic amino acid/polyamine antiporter, APA family